MAHYNLTLKKKEEIAEGTMAFHFDKPEGLSFLPGQHGEFMVDKLPNPDAEGNSRIFSMASAPHEGDLVVATRMRDTAFKRFLKDAPEGTSVVFDGPMGSFTLHNNVAKPAVFVIGGIGITPVRSIIADATHRKLPHAITLFYSNRRPEDTAFFDDLKQFEKENPNFHLIATITEPEKSSQPWSGETGYINAAMLEKHLGSSMKEALYYLAGPQGMVSAMRKLLDSANINSDNIRTEEFSGY